MPATINHSFGEMRPYQIAGLNWLANLYQNGACSTPHPAAEAATLCGRGCDLVR